jgi:hypothetical protein
MSQMTPTGRLTVRRKGGYWRDHVRAYRVLIDGRKVGSLRENEALTVELPAGSHDLSVRVDWTGTQSVPVEVEANRDHLYEVSPSQTPIAGFFSSSGWLELRSDEDSSPAAP